MCIFKVSFSLSPSRLFANQYLSFFDIEFPVHKITVIRLLVYVFVSDTVIAHARLFLLPRKCFFLNFSRSQSALEFLECSVFEVRKAFLDVKR